MNPNMKRTTLHLTAAALLMSAAHSQALPDNDARLAPVTGLQPDHATLSVGNLPAEAAWYEHVLGFKIRSKSNDPGYVNWHLVIPGYRIDLIAAPGSIPAPTVEHIYQRQGWVHVSFHVSNVAAALSALRVLHVPTTVKKDAKGNPVQLRIHDPEGNEIEIRRNLVL
jgi:catechol 2,3-dioxygenase-like lactoylglutathione lyase family enzyme